MLVARFIVLVVIIFLVGCNLVSSGEPVAIIVTSPPVMTCEELVTSAIDTTTQACVELESDEICYGHAQVMADFEPDSAVRFNLPGDSAELSTIRNINTSALSEAGQTWGVTVMKAGSQQHEVMFILFGDLMLDGITPDMSTVTLRTGSKAVSCAPTPALLVQSPEDSQVTLNLNGVGITLGSTVHITAIENDAMEISVIEGTVVVAASNATRIVRPGAQVRVPLNGLNASGAPSEPIPFDIASVQDAPLGLLERHVHLPQPIAGPTVPPVGSTLTTSTIPPVTLPPSSTRTPPTCTVRSDWADTYTVQLGDNLSTIARQYGIPLRELQEGNCIANPDLIRAGQVLHVPVEAATDTPTLPTSAPPSTPTTAIFRAAETVLGEGQCTIVRWDVDNVASVYFEDELTTGHNSQEVCPTETASYRLTVVYPDGRQVPYTLRIEVSAAPAATEEVQ